MPLSYPLSPCDIALQSGRTQTRDDGRPPDVRLPSSRVWVLPDCNAISHMDSGYESGTPMADSPGWAHPRSARYAGVSDRPPGSELLTKAHGCKDGQVWKRQLRYWQPPATFSNVLDHRRSHYQRHWLPLISRKWRFFLQWFFF